MSIVAIYNLKGGVGKTTTAINLSFLSAAAGARTLLWDLDPQGASSFAFRIHPSVAGFGRKSLETDRTLAAAIKESDFERLDVLPADFAYRKMDRLLGDRSKPERVIADLLRALGRDYDAIFLDCPPGFSLLTEAVFAASHMVLVPTIPTVLSLRTLARLVRWAHRNEGAPLLVAFLSMVDRRKALHRRICQWAAHHPDVFVRGHIPYASVVEQMAVRRMPLPAFAAGDPVEIAFRTIGEAVRACLQTRAGSNAADPGTDVPLYDAIEALIGELELGSNLADLDRENASGQPSGPPSATDSLQVVHSFDTDRRDLERTAYVLELHERSGSFQIVAARSDATAGETDRVDAVRAQVDARWAMQVLTGAMSPLTALERRLGQPTSSLVSKIQAAVGERTLRRVSSLCVESGHPRSLTYAASHADVAAP
jgi:chromosome partitioning protein